MKAALINGSPRVAIEKTDVSASMTLLAMVKRSLRRSHIHDFEEYHLKTGELSEETKSGLLECDVWIFSFPVYCGGIPSHILSCMKELSSAARERAEGGWPVEVAAAVSGCVFDGFSAQLPLAMLANWCEQNELVWLVGMGAGGGPMLAAHGPYAGIRRWRRMGRCVNYLCENVAAGRARPNIYCGPGMPRRKYSRRLYRLLRKRR